jgi:hypothetical protein
MKMVSQLKSRSLAFLKSHPAAYRFARYGVYARLRSLHRKAIFERFYSQNLWEDAFSVSGPGSSLTSTSNLREVLPRALKHLGITRFLDIPCGDFKWMSQLDFPVGAYTGADIVPQLIEKNRRTYGDRGEFLCLDLLRDPLPMADAIFCRDCLVHLSYREIRAALRNVRASSAAFFLTTTFPDLNANEDTVTPYWRPLNFEKAPFNFPEPLYLIRDYADGQINDAGKHLGCWRVEDIPA